LYGPDIIRCGLRRDRRPLIRRPKGCWCQDSHLDCGGVGKIDGRRSGCGGAGRGMSRSAAWDRETMSLPSPLNWQIEVLILDCQVSAAILVDLDGKASPVEHRAELAVCRYGVSRRQAGSVRIQDIADGF